DVPGPADGGPGRGGPGGKGPPFRDPAGDDRAGGGPGAGWAPALRRLRRSVAAELVVALIVLALTAVLVNTATGRESYAPTVSASQPFSTGGPGGAGTVHVFGEPGRV